jgi:hypothetical protein
MQQASAAALSGPGVKSTVRQDSLSWALALSAGLVWPLWSSSWWWWSWVLETRQDHRLNNRLHPPLRHYQRTRGTTTQGSLQHTPTISSHG